jgi:hypothetical protein
MLDFSVMKRLLLVAVVYLTVTSVSQYVTSVGIMMRE